MPETDGGTNKKQSSRLTWKKRIIKFAAAEPKGWIRELADVLGGRSVDADPHARRNPKFWLQHAGLLTSTPAGMLGRDNQQGPGMIGVADMVSSVIR